MTETPKPLTAGELNEIRNRADAATQGPWDYDWGTRTGTRCNYHTRDWAVWKGGLMANLANDSNNEPDACFIAHSRSDIPRLLTTIDSLQAEVERLRKLTEWRPIETAPKGYDKT